jgi:uncharacterized membrane protein YeaQ/YmgE (transglycosylase-associated protein family)
MFAGFLFFGTLIGVVVRMLVAGRAGGWGPSICSGAVGALLGGWLGRMDALRSARDSGGLCMALLGAFVLVAFYHRVAATRRVGDGRLSRP